MLTSHRAAKRRWHTVIGSTLALALVATACTSGDDDDDSVAPEGDAIGDGDTYQAVIRRTEGNVPHIVGDSLADVTFGQGWASGEDRACDLADQVVKVKGERSRWHGRGEDDVHLNSDIAWRTIGIADIAAEDWKSASPDVVELVTAFTDGWNAHLEQAGVPGLDGWCAGAEWVQPLEPVDVYAYGRSIALQASSGAVADFIPTAQPPDTDGDQAPTDDDPNTGADDSADTDDGPPADEDEAAAVGPPERIVPAAEEIASNAWAFGSERTAEGGGMLLANPHFPWEGELRFWESHLTIPDELDIYGAQLSGLPGIGIGFTENFAWSHTVSIGNRFTAYRVELVPGDPTDYRFGDEVREMTSTPLTVEVLADDGSIEEVSRTMWSTHYGPVIDFPGVGWSDALAITYRDANIDNDEIFDQFLGMTTAKDLDQFIGVHEQVTGVPLFNTIATSSDGRAWYADTSATPNLSDEALERYEQLLDEDPLVAGAADNGAVLLDGSDPVFEWVEAEGARDPGLVPFADMPQVERDDYVFNANDSFWLPHAEATIEGDFSRLHGEQRTGRTPRTRENAVVLGDTSPQGPAGDDGRFTLDELADAALANQGHMARRLLDEVVARCDGAGPEFLPQVPAEDDGGDPLPPGSVFIGAACAALADWDGVYETDRIGPPIWREFLHRFEQQDGFDAGPLWAEPFDPERPVETPSGLAQPSEGQPDLVLEHLARAVQILDREGIPVDATLGDVQFALRDGEKVPIHGGDNFDGTTNIVGFGTSASILDPALDELDAEEVASGSTLRRIGSLDGEAGYLVNNGTSFLMTVELTDAGPRAKAHLTYGNSEDRSNADYVEATRRFSTKEWRDVAFTDDQVEAATTDTQTVRG